MKQLFAIAALVAVFTAQAPEPHVAVRAARLIDGRGGAPIEAAVVLVRGDRIEAAGAGLPIPAGTRAIDLRTALHGARNALVTLRAGFTTCRDMGPTWPFTDVDLRKAIDEGVVPGPRLLLSKGTPPGAHPYTEEELRVERVTWVMKGGVVYVGRAGRE